ncbi:hypothetical protein BT63DRAFT_459306 [Microthyrium microscopicum]|uniref:Uncharacterized protein n=1 Tax=Microthyrium microscopicum TaxID=703497 RepID=A0A6A6U258_9PEZI|nr:hypothetical protein BT63DRAFT_459306 [Microthyrium microscopicum]
MKFTSTTAALLAAVPVVFAQTNCTTVNTNTGCKILGYDVIGATYYYATTDAQEVGENLQAVGCSAGSTAQVFAKASNGQTYPCSNLLLDGTSQLVQCTGLTRGTVPAGSLGVYVAIPGSNGTTTVSGTYTIAHTQASTTVVAPTLTATTTPLSTVLTTKTTTFTNTVQAAPKTATLAVLIGAATVTVIPAASTVTSTVKQTLGSTVVKFAVVSTTVTAGATCTGTYRVAPAGLKKRGDEDEDEVPEPRNLMRRQLNAGIGLLGDGPATVSVYPSAAILTTTAATGVTTVTLTASAADAVVTVAASPATVTIEKGLLVATKSVTAVKVTFTKTVATTTSLAVVTTTSTLTYTATVQGSPTTCAKPAS